MPDFTMPSLGADMEVGRVVAWHVRPGDPVRRGEVIADVETDKGTFEVESPFDGKLREIVVELGLKVPVGTRLATIEAPAGARAAATPVAGMPPAAAGMPPAAAAAPGPAPVTPAAVQAPVPQEAHAPRRRASPAARKLAADADIDLDRVTGTGPGGIIRRGDVERAVAGEMPPAPPSAAVAPPPPTAPAAPGAAPAAPAAPALEESRSAMRRAVAAVVSRSKREIPHYYLATDVDLQHAMHWMQEENRRRRVEDRLLPGALVCTAVARAVRRFPLLNGFWLEGELRPSEAVHLGLAISQREGGLLVPAIHDADRLSLDQMMGAMRDVVGRARHGGLRGSEVTDATITVSNLGDLGVTTVFGIIYPPQVALVGFGRIAERAWAEEGAISARPVITLSLAADHRATNGHYGGLFLAEVGRLLQDPEGL